ncbi:MAG TPA: SGNH/GDSL hydrolase family protein [Pyrinomonadaceae bacterium]|jgi:lysophospholipase L1-like esterase
MKVLGRIKPAAPTRNWVFLGDSLTEGVGSQRVSHVTELVNHFRADRTNVHHLRLRTVDPRAFDRLVQFNLAGYLSTDPQDDPTSAFCIWNLACEGQTIETDFNWLPLIAAIKPELVMIFRGSLESIIRPAMVYDGSWPTWVPPAWRNYSSMDPRCYFSSTPWRRIKQTTIDSLKQRTRLRLLKSRPGRPLMDLDTFANHYLELATRLRDLQARVLMLGLLPVGEYFPESAAYFVHVNQRLRDIATTAGADFYDWAAPLRANGFHELLYRDTFHPNPAGAKKLADILWSHLGTLNL